MGGVEICTVFILKDSFEIYFWQFLVEIVFFIKSPILVSCVCPKYVFMATSTDAKRKPLSDFFELSYAGLLKCLTYRYKEKALEVLAIDLGLLAASYRLL